MQTDFSVASIRGSANRRLHAGGIALAAILVMFFAAFAADADALTNGTDAPDTPLAQATVFTGRVQPRGCTGTLVARDLVLSAGHCVGHTNAVNRPHPPFRGNLSDDWERPDTFYPLSVIREEENIDVTVAEDGVFNADDPGDFLTTVTHYAVPGDADMILLRLAQPVPSAAAVPAPILSNLPTRVSRSRGWVADQRFRGAGFQKVSPFRLRHAALGSGQFPCPSQTAHKVCTRTRDGSGLEQGDSGGPLYWTSPRGTRYLAGSLQAAGGDSAIHVPAFFRGGSCATRTCTRGDTRIELPNLGGWLDRMVRGVRPINQPLSSGRIVTVRLHELIASSDDACRSGMDFYGNMRFIAGASGRVPIRLVNNRDARSFSPPLRLEARTAPGVRFVNAEIEIRDDDSALCGGRDDVVDIVPNGNVKDLRFRIDLQDQSVQMLDSVRPILGGTGTWWSDGRDGREEARVVFSVNVRAASS